jgi:hypothetical protein
MSEDRMSEDLETARRYRSHARELRAIAKSEAAEPNRHTLLAVARDYEKMAKALEVVHRTNTHAGKTASFY